MVKAVGYAYPWDYQDDPAAASRVAELGLDVVALAASYHASRSVSPLHPSRRIREVDRSALYVAVRAEAWWGRRLVPRAPAWGGHEDLFSQARDQLVAHGLKVHAWIVLTHDDDLGRTAPDLVVRNAFDDAYEYALCPSSPEVVEYCRTLAREVAALSACDGVVLEACGPMGVVHASQHDKVEFAQWNEAATRLLSLCFCDACRRGMSTAGVDVDELSRRVRDGVDDGATSVTQALGSPLCEEVARFRTDATAHLRETVVRGLLEVNADVSITVHASASEWATGSFASLRGSGSLEGITSAVANCWDPLRGTQELADLRELTRGRCQVGGYLRLDSGWSDRAEVVQTLDRYRAVGLDEIHLYHLGLLSRSGLETLAQVADLARKL
ncbi:MAG: hypothetical protein WA786_06345 [Acidimicrobiales bacterium]